MLPLWTQSLFREAPLISNQRFFSRSATSETASADPDRERTDFALLDYSLADQKPVLAICYGVQSLNVFLGGTLLQDIPSELPSPIEHEWEDDLGAPETFHAIQIEPGSGLSKIAGANDVRVNSSHHQSILEPGRNLRVVARASDQVIEAVEWAGGSNFVIGVQWHPERMAETDPFAQALFASLVAAASKSPLQA